MFKRLLILGSFTVFLCSVAYGSFLDGNANKVIGQMDFTHNGVNLTNGQGLVDPYGVTIDTINNRVFVADADNHRVLWWNGISGFSNGQAASGVLGQADLLSADVNRGIATPTQNSMNRPMAIAVDGLGRVWVADYDNRRVVRFSPPLSTGMNADLVLGQANYTTSNTGYDAHSFGDPSGIAISADNSSVWVCDAVNSRVLRFDAPFSNGMDATVVVGQTGMFSTGYSCTQSSFHYPWGISVDRLNRLWVADYANNRVMRFSPPYSTGMNADAVLGQSDYISNSGSTSQNRMHFPYAVFNDNSNNVFVAEGNDLNYLTNYVSGSNRVVHFSAPFSNGMNADMVIGQPDYFSSNPNQTGGAIPDNDTLYFPMGGAVDQQGKLWVADTFNHRVVCYPTPLSNGMSANLVFGQVNFVHSAPNMVKPNGLYYPMGITVDSANDRVFVADTNNRVLWWNSIASYNNGDAAAGALGQPDLTSDAIDRGQSTPNAGGLDWPADVAVDHSGKVWVVDYYNHRVLRYSPPLSTGMSADLVLGQVNFSNASPGTGAASFNYPFDVAIDPSNNVWVADLLNHRILRFNGASLSNGMNADMVIGQSDLYSANSGVSPTQLTRPSGMCFDAQGNLFVADRNNARILRFPAPLSTGMAADLVLGQSDFYSGGAGLSATALSSRPVKVQVDSLGNVWVADRLNNRVVRFEVPLSSGMAADLVLGQADFISGTENRNVAVSANTMYNPMDIALDANDNLWEDDYLNSRVLRFDSFKITSLSPATGAPGTTTPLITVTGRGIAAGTSIKLSRAGSSDIAGSNVTVVNATQLTCQFNLTGAAIGFWNVVLQSGGVSSTLKNGFEVKNGFSVNSVSPSSGFNNISQDVSITGTGFLAGSQVKLAKAGQADINATNITVVSNSQINCRFNLVGAATGNWDVVVSSNSTTGTLSGGFQVLPVAAISVYSVLPSSGINNGTKNVTITGAGFLTGSTANLSMTGQSNINATNITVVSGTQITCRFNLAGAAIGSWNVTVSSNGISGTLNGGFQIQQASVYSVSPSSGINNGTKNVTITGAGFLTGSTVNLAMTGQSNINATNVTVVSDAQINCSFNLSGAATGFWNLTVSTNSVNASLANAFKVLTTAVYSMSPSSSLNSGTINATITGDGFVSGSTVKLAMTGQSDINATNITVINATQITCAFNLAGAAVGFWNLTVSTGTVSATLTNACKVFIPTITSISPSSGLNNGTKNTTITGTGFLSGSTLKLSMTGQSDINATSVSVVSDTQITCQFNLTGATAGFWNLTVSTNGVNATLASGFQVLPSTFSVYSVAPSVGSNNGTKDVVITGAGFVSGSTVKLAKTGQSDINASNITVVSDTQITCRFNLLGVVTGNWDVVVTANGVSSTLSSAFQIVPMSLLSITPATGSNKFSKNVSLTGTGFLSGSVVRLTRTGQSDIYATGITVVNDTQITCTFNLIGAAVGFWNVVVSTNGVAVTLPNGFIITDTSVYGVIPSSGLNNGIMNLTISGDGFMNGSTVRLGTIDATNVVVVNDTKITCQVNLAGAAAGFRTLAVSYNGVTLNLSNAFEVLAQRVDSVSPSQGYALGSQTLTINGANFVTGTTAKLTKTGYADINATSNSLINNTQMSCVFNLTGAAPGLWNLTVSSNSASGTLANAFNVISSQIYSVSPSSGMKNGTINATITGAGFLTGSTVNLAMTGQSNINATNVAVVSDTQITCKLNLTGAATGFWNLNVASNSVTAALANAFNVYTTAIYSVSPSSSVNNGILNITITGAGFLQGSRVALTMLDYSPINASNVTVVNDSLITCQFYNMGTQTGFWNLTVSSGSASVTMANAINLYSSVIYSMSPSNGINNGTINATITGIGFLPGSTAVLMKSGLPDINATNVTTVSDTQITCKFDLTGATTGFRFLRVIANGVETTLWNAIEVNSNAINVYSVTPSSGVNNGAANVTVTGAGFVPGSTVNLTMAGQSNINASNITVVSGTQLTCKCNLAGAATGFWNLTVSTNSANGVLPNAFKVYKPDIYSVSPSSGLNSGLKNVMIIGSGFISGSTVKLNRTGFSDINATNVTVVNDTLITCSLNTSGANAGLWNVTVSTNGVDVSRANAFQILALELDSCSPDTVYNNGISTVTVYGANFVPGMTLKFSKTGQTDITPIANTFISDTQIKYLFNFYGAAAGYWNIIIATSSASIMMPDSFQILYGPANSVTPSNGYNNTTVNLTITGGGFAAGATVKLRMAGQADINATNITVVSGSQITCQVNLTGAVAGVRDVVINSNGSDYTITSGFEVLPMSVYSVAPSSGVNNGTKDVIITGAGFLSGSTVKLSKTGQADINASNIVVVNDTHITCRFNLAGAVLGNWDIVVTANGVSASLSSGFQVLPVALSVISVTPSNGVNNTTKDVTVTGTGFLSGSTVKLSKTGQTDINATNITVVSDTQITCRFNLVGAVIGNWDLVVTAGGVNATLTGGFQVVAMSVTSISPSSGLNNGLKYVTITGAGFLSGATVKLAQTGQSDINATNITVVSDTQITCTFNLAGAVAGLWNLSVTANGVSAVLANSFQVLALQVSSVNPTSAYNNGSAPMIVYGSNFVSGMTVKLSKTGQSDIIPSVCSFVSNTQINCTFNFIGCATGNWDVVASSNSASTTLAGGFQILPMSVVSVAPSSGMNTGTKDVTITGAGFLSGATVKLAKSGQADINASNITVVSGTQITCRFNLAGAVLGNWDIVVTANGVSASLSGGFQVLPVALSVISVTPSNGVNNATKDVTVTGTGFLSGSTVKLSKTGQTDITASNITVVSDTQITCRFNLVGASTGNWDLVVTAGGVNATLTGGFQVVAMSVASISPSSGLNNGLKYVTITGAGFLSGATVKLAQTGQADINATNITVVSDTQITCAFNLAGAVAGLWNLSVTANGVSAVLANSFQVLALQVSSVNPGNAYNNGSASVAVYGSNFVSGTTVKLSKTGQSDIIPSVCSFVSNTQINCTFNFIGCATGNWDVVVSSNSASTTLAGGFQILPMSVVSVAPSSGMNTGTKDVTITGAGFLSGSTVKLAKTGQADINASNITVVSNTQITCRFNLAGAVLGNWDIVVTANGVSATLSSGFQVLPVALSVISVTPSNGVNNATKDVTVTGTGFLSGSTVKLSKTGQTDINASNITVVSDTQITCRFNLVGASTGNWDLVVTAGGVNATLTGGFQVVAMSVTSISPSSGLNSGLKNVTITGAGFLSGATVKLGRSGQADINAANITVVSDTQITCAFNLAGAVAGFWNLTVTVNGINASLANSFEVLALQFDSMSPDPVYNNGSTLVSVYGTNFAAGTLVKLSKSGQADIIPNTCTVINGTQINCMFNFTSAPAGLWSVTISTGSASITAANAIEIRSFDIYSIDPVSGYNNTTTNFIIDGDGFRSGCMVKLTKSGQSDISATNVVVTGSTQITCRVNLVGASAGFWNVLISSNSASYTLTSGFQVLPMAVSSVTPSSGMNNGTKDVTITGAGFLSGSTVKLAKTGQTDINASNITVVSDTQITCRFNLAGAVIGNWDIVVTAGGVSASLSNGFQVLPVALSVSSVSPANGVNNATKDVTVTGTGFLSGSTVKLSKMGQADINASNITVVSDTQITCRFNLVGATTGNWDLVVTAGGVNATLTSGFQIVPMSIYSVAPISGANNGVKNLTITGTGFLTGSTVKLARSGQADINGTNITVVSDTQITCQVNLAGAVTGNWDLVVTAGGVNATLTSGFQIVPMSIYSVAPISGANNGVKNLTITGTGFLTGSTVKLARSGQADINASNITVVSDTQITCQVNLAGVVTGNWDLVVTAGGVNATLTGGFQIVPMSIYSVAPISGANNGVKNLTITGTGFLTGSTVKLARSGQADINASNITVVSDTQITCQVNLAGAVTGNWDVVVTVNSTNATLTGGFQIVPMSVFSIAPASGLNNGTKNVTINGAGFLSGSTVKLSKAGQADISATNIVVVNDTQITCRFNLAGAATGNWDIVVTASGVSASLSSGFQVLSVALSVSAVTPSSGVNNATKDVTVTGSGFLSGSTVKLSKTGQTDINASNITVVSDTQITCRFNLVGVSTGNWDLVVTAGGVNATLTGGFQIVPMSIYSVAPVSGANNGVKNLTITGAGFLTGSTVKLGRTGQADINASNITVVSDTQITCQINLAGAATGNWDVVVTVNGTNATLPGGFQVVPMSVTSVLPSSGINNATKDVTINGAGFISGATVKLSKTGQVDINATNITVVSNTQITCRFNLAGAATGNWDIVVTANGVNATLASGFQVFPVSVYSVTPSSGVNNGSKNIAVTGAGFLSGSSVKLTKTGQPDIYATNVTVLSDTQLTCRFDLSNANAGKWDLVVITGGMSAILTGGFQVLPEASNSIVTSASAPINLILDAIDYTAVINVPAQTFSQDVVLTATKLKTTYGTGSQGLVTADMIFELTNDKNLQPQKDMTITITYHDNVVAGVDRSRLSLFYYDDASGQWIAFPSVAMASNRKLVAEVHHLSIFRVFQRVPADDLTNVSVYPNPYKPNSPGAYNGDTALGKGIVFSGLTANCRVKIFTIAGELVRELTGSDTDSTLLWDTVNENGDKVASGVYLYYLTDRQNDGKKTKGKIVIIR